MKSEFKKRNWDRLLSEIEEKKVIPVIGSELLIMEMEGRKVFFYEYLAQELADRLEVDKETLSDNFSLDKVTTAFLANHGDPADIYFEIKEIISSRDWTIPEPLRLLAEIQHFTLFLSTTFDPFMKQALDMVRYGGDDKTITLAYSNMGEVVDLSLETAPPSLVFQLFGKVSTSPDYAVMDDDLLRFNHRLQSRDLRPHNLFDRLRSHYMLTLGCSFPNWLARFFFCATKGDILFSNLGMRGVVADKETIKDANLNRFLSRRKALLYQHGDAVDFIVELHRRWNDRFGNTSAPCPMKKNMLKNEMPAFLPESIFLSYASEDQEVAFLIKQQLEAEGIDVWYDKRRLEAGDDYEAKILRNIIKSSFFFPVISKNTITGQRRFFRLEWHEAIKESRFRPTDSPFIQPIVIDDTGYDASNIPSEFGKRHWQWFPKGKISEEFLLLTRQRIRKLRRQKRDL